MSETEHANGRERGPEAAPLEEVGWRDGLAALRAPFENGSASLRILGPWMLLASGGLITIAAWPAERFKTQPPWLSALMGLTAFILPLIAVPTVAVAWHRFIAAATLPRLGIALPGRTAFGYHRRLWLALMAPAFLAGAAARMAPAIAHYLHIANVLALIAVLACLAGLAGLALASQFALVLPAVAMGDRRVNLMLSAAVTRKLVPSFWLGLLVAIGPFAVLLMILLASWERWTRLELSLALMVLVGGAVSVFLLMVASAAGYLSRVYVRTIGLEPE